MPAQAIPGVYGVPCFTRPQNGLQRGLDIRACGVKNAVPHGGTRLTLLFQHTTLRGGARTVDFRLLSSFRFDFRSAIGYEGCNDCADPFQLHVGAGCNDCADPFHSHGGAGWRLAGPHEVLWVFFAGQNSTKPRPVADRLLNDLPSWQGNQSKESAVTFC